MVKVYGKMTAKGFVPDISETGIVGYNENINEDISGYRIPTGMSEQITAIRSYCIKHKTLLPSSIPAGFKSNGWYVGENSVYILFSRVG